VAIWALAVPVVLAVPTSAARGAGAADRRLTAHSRN
jgi:hypothetical protein